MMIDSMNNIVIGRTFRAVVIGASSGGLDALKTVLEHLPFDFSLPVLVVQHLAKKSDDYLARYLNRCCLVKVKEAEEKEKIEPGTVYIAPPGYHLLVEADCTVAFSMEELVNFSRPSIDVLFESAADAFGSALIGIILTGGNQDGSQGLRTISRRGGVTVVQNPDSAVADAMPRAALAAIKADYILPLEEIGMLLKRLAEEAFNDE